MKRHSMTSVTKTTLASVFLVAGLSVATQAGVVADLSIGTNPPPMVFGGYPMTPFPLDERPLYDDVAGVPAPGGGGVAFDPMLNHRRIGDGWATWSHGYAGDVYYSNGGSTVTLTLPVDTYAFYFYAEPNNFSTYTISATSNSGAGITQEVEGSSGAKFFGFYGTHGDTLATITIVADDAAGGFAVGEFGIARAPTCEGLGVDATVGTDPPPATLGGYTMTPFAEDPRPLFDDVLGVPAPGGDFVRFCPEANHRRIGQGWATWSHDYAGDVYFRDGNQITLTLPPGTFAFYFYAEPNLFASYSITAVADSGYSITQNVEGASGARYYGFYSCNDGDTIKTIIIRADEEAGGFAIGEFGIAREPLCLGIGVDLTPGTDAPPDTLGGYEVIPFLPDPRPLQDDVDFVFAPLGTTVAFNIPVNHRRIGQGWATWSHDYTGDVYYTNGSQNLTLLLPPDTYAFYFYVEPNPFSPIQFIVQANDGTEVSEVVEGASGARYFGFYTCSGDVSLTSITIMAESDFAVGEFGIGLRDRGQCGLLTESIVGTNPPPPVLGDHAMIPFDPDPRPLGDPVSGAPAPLGNILSFSQDLTHVRIGQGWGTWSHDYTGDVYYTLDSTVTLVLPADTYAFYFYAEPNLFSDYQITAIADDGSEISQIVTGASGARYYGFYACSCRTTISFIEIQADPAANGFAVGEFGIALTPREAVLGDLNCDGLLNAFDIDAFILALTDPDGYAAAYPCCFRALANINGDGAINAFDIDPFINLLIGG